MRMIGAYGTAHAQLHASTRPQRGRLACRLAPLSVHMPTVLSMDAEKSSLQVDEYARHVMAPLCPCCVRSSVPVLASQTCNAMARCGN